MVASDLRRVTRRFGRHLSILLAVLLGLASIPLTVYWMQTAFTMQDSARFGGPWVPDSDLLFRSAGLATVAAALAGSLAAYASTRNVLGRTVVAVAVAWSVACLTLMIVPAVAGINLDLNASTWGTFCLTVCARPTEDVAGSAMGLPFYYFFALGAGAAGTFIVWIPALVFAVSLGRNGQTTLAWAAAGVGFAAVAWVTISSAYPPFGVLLVGSAVWAPLASRVDRASAVVADQANADPWAAEKGPLKTDDRRAHWARRRGPARAKRLG
jgi:hypothetical protein